MDKLNFLKNKKVLVGISAVIVILIIVWFLKFPKQEIKQEVGKTENASQQETVSEQTAPQVAIQTQTSKKSAPSTTTQQKTTTSSVQIIQRVGLSIVSPAGGESWVMGKAHLIRWTHEEGHNGSISLIDASSKAVVGWIASNLSPQQVTYDWDTARVGLARTDPSKKEISGGTYIIRVVFDSSNTKLESAPFQIISSGTDNILNREIFIRNGIFIPNFIEAQKGERVVIINDDGNNSRTVKMGGAAVVKLFPRDSYIFPITQAGEYIFGLAENVISKLTVSVK